MKRRHPVSKKGLKAVMKVFALGWATNTPSTPNSMLYYVMDIYHHQRRVEEDDRGFRCK